MNLLVAFFFISVTIMISLASSFRTVNRFVKLRFNRSSKSSLSQGIYDSSVAYNKLESFQIKEYGLIGDWYKHKKTGAEVSVSECIIMLYDNIYFYLDSFRCCA